MMFVHPGLPINTPHGVGVVVSVRNDGIVVTRLLAAGGGSSFTGFFHPSSVGPLLSLPAGAPYQAVASPPGVLQQVSPVVDCSRGSQPSNEGMPSGVSTAKLQQPCRALENPCTAPPSKRRRSSDNGIVLHQ